MVGFRLNVSETDRWEGMIVIKGSAGWVGRQVRICRLCSDTSVQTVATIRLDQGKAVCDDPKLLSEWVADGVKGRPDTPRLFPKDGQRFLDELPYVYRYTYLWAEPADEEPSCN